MNRVPTIQSIKKLPLFEGVKVESEGFEPTSRQELKETSTCLAELEVPATYGVFLVIINLLTRNQQIIPHEMMPKN